MKNEEIKQLIAKYAAGMTKDEGQELFEWVTNKPEDPNEKLWAENILSSSIVIKNHIGADKAAELLVTAYDEYKQNYPNAFEHKVDILRDTFELQTELKRISDAHGTMNRYLYNALAQVSFATNIPKMRYYSFRGISNYSLDEIENERITLAHPREFNDPLDTILVWWLNNEIKMAKKSEQEMNFRLMMKKASEHIKMRCLIGSKYKENDVWKEREVEDLSVLMWAHYANSHAGMCTLFDFEKSFFKTGAATDEKKLVMIAPIEYTQIIDLSKGEPSMKEALFQKSNFWDYENEMRLCLFDVDKNEDYPYIECKNAIKAVYLGVKCSDADRRTVEKAIGDKDIPLYQMAVDEKKLTRLKKIQIG